MSQVMTTSAMTYAGQNLPPARRGVSKTAFGAWLAQATRGQQIEYHRGHLVWDRALGSSLTSHERRALSRVADAALEAAVAGLVRLVQCRYGRFDFGYRAIRTGRRVGSVPTVPDRELPTAA